MSTGVPQTRKLPRGVVRGGQLSEVQQAIDKLVGEGLTRPAIALKLGVQLGVIDLTGMPATELYSFVASWIRNRVDVTWAEETAAALSVGPGKEG